MGGGGEAQGSPAAAEDPPSSPLRHAHARTIRHFWRILRIHLSLPAALRDSIRKEEENNNKGNHNNRKKERKTQETSFHRGKCAKCLCFMRSGAEGGG